MQLTSKIFPRILPAYFCIHADRASPIPRAQRCPPVRIAPPLGNGPPQLWPAPYNFLQLSSQRNTHELSCLNRTSSKLEAHRRRPLLHRLQAILSLVHADQLAPRLFQNLLALLKGQILFDRSRIARPQPVCDLRNENRCDNNHRYLYNSGIGVRSGPKSGQFCKKYFKGRSTSLRVLSFKLRDSGA